ncbi:MAG: CBS domain-containing protein [Planctomycetota bacterium]
MKVSELMTKKVKTVDRQMSVTEALKIMEESNIRHLVVTRAGKPESIISDRDLLVVLSIPSDQENPITVGQISSKHPITLKLETDVKEAAQFVLDKKVSAFPILDEKGNLAGIITTHDLIRLLLQKI